VGGDAAVAGFPITGDSTVTTDTTPSAPPGAWEMNVAIAIAAVDWTEPIAYRTLLAAIALAEAGGDIAARAVEENALVDGFAVGIHAFGSEYPTHAAHLEPCDLELAVRLARQLLMPGATL
jgi:hypothetical protein